MKRFLKSLFSGERLLLLVVWVAMVSGVVIAYLNHEVVSQFEGKRFAIPARMYARPLELYTGMSLQKEQLRYELKNLNYSHRNKISAPGQFVDLGDTIHLYSRPFTFWDGEQAAEPVRIDISGNRVRSLTNMVTGENIDLLRLDPMFIGGIYPGQGEDRQLVRLDQVPNHIVQALLAIEDKRFYQHKGVDPKAVLRAFGTVFSGGRIHGGSTITQQLVKNFYLTNERTIQRKVKEMLMALILEYHYSKEEILETYLNEVYLGQDRNRAVHGMALASQYYFARDLEHLKLQHSAMLVAMLKGPIFYNPRKHPKRVLDRRNLVLSEMYQQGFIDEFQYFEAADSPLDVSEKPNTGQSLYPAFVDLVLRQLRRDYQEEDLNSEGLKIFTSLNPYVQSVSEKALTGRLNVIDQYRTENQVKLDGAVVITDVASGEVEAVVGGRRPRYQGFNRALDASRQIGSLIKPATYLTALQQPEKYTLVSPISDEPFVWQEPGIEDWMPKNYDEEFHGEVPLWLALAKSYNVASARLGTDLGVHNVMSTVHKLGIDKKLPNYASGLLGTMALSPLEVAQMYHTMASGGFRTPFRAIRAVMTQDELPLKRYPLNIEQTISSEANTLIVHAMKQVVQRGTGSGLSRFAQLHDSVAGKTGTTDDLRDSWFAGFSGDRVAVVWVGNDKNESTGLTGATGALLVWGDAMAKLNPRAIQTPPSDLIEFSSIDDQSGFQSSNCHANFTLPFISGSAPQENPCNQPVPTRTKNWFKRLIGG